jgi:hypothetical protein
MDRSQLTDLYFAEARSKLIDVAAFLDRIERSEGKDDFRIKSLRAVLREMEKPDADKARRILLLLSDPTTEPIPKAGTKSATGAWAGF